MEITVYKDTSGCGPLASFPGQFKMFQIGMGMRLIGYNPAPGLFLVTTRENEPG